LSAAKVVGASIFSRFWPIAYPIDRHDSLIVSSSFHAHILTLYWDRSAAHRPRRISWSVVNGNHDGAKRERAELRPPGPVLDEIATLLDGCGTSERTDQQLTHGLLDSYVGAKARAASRALDYVTDGMVVGLGSGSTAREFIEQLSQRVRLGLPGIRCVASSMASSAFATELGLTVASLNEVASIDVYVDGADEIGPGLSLIKGRGGALVGEKIVASAAERFIVIADATKLVARLGAKPVPVEVIPMAMSVVERRLAERGLHPVPRMHEDDDSLYVTDGSNHILDCDCGLMEDPRAIAATIRSTIGVVDHGLFLDMASLAIVAGATDIVVLEP
jgi:ribose 5-phosphate isomerase A